MTTPLVDKKAAENPERWNASMDWMPRSTGFPDKLDSQSGMDPKKAWDSKTTLDCQNGLDAKKA